MPLLPGSLTVTCGTLVAADPAGGAGGLELSVVVDADGVAHYALVAADGKGRTVMLELGAGGAQEFRALLDAAENAAARMAHGGMIVRMRCRQTGELVARRR